MLKLLYKDLKLAGLKISGMALAVTAVVAAVSMANDHDFVKFIMIPTLFMLIGFQAIFHYDEHNCYFFTENSLPISKTRIVIKNFILMFIFWVIGILLALGLNYFQQLIESPYYEKSIIETTTNSFWLNIFFFSVVLLNYSIYGKYRQALYMATFSIITAGGIFGITTNFAGFTNMYKIEMINWLYYILIILATTVTLAIILVLINQEQNTSIKQKYHKTLLTFSQIIPLMVGLGLIINIIDLVAVHYFMSNFSGYSPKFALGFDNLIINTILQAVLLIIVIFTSRLISKRNTTPASTEIKTIYLLPCACIGYAIHNNVSSSTAGLWTIGLYTIIISLPAAIHFFKAREFK